jgi:hypothetical protein
MVRRISIAIAACSLGLALGAGTVFAAASPSTGQPSQSCGLNPNVPGFQTAGFAGAALVYAGSPSTPSLANGSSVAVSQYDVACTKISKP